LEKSSLQKILLALILLSAYTFIFGIMGVIEPVSSHATVTETAQTDLSEPENKPEPEETTTINVYNSIKPGLADYEAPVSSRLPPSFDPEPAETDLPQTTEATTSIIILDNEPPPETTTSATTAASTQPTPEPTTEATTAFEPPTSDETFQVIANGVVVTGSAFDIVSRVVQNEIGAAFHKEAVKAQAVAAYTYIKRQNMLGSTPSVALASVAHDRIKELVSEVLGQGIYYNNELIQSVYCASSAGYTASSVNVWGSDLPYLRSVKCAFDERYDPNFGRTATFTSSEIALNVLRHTGIELTGDPEGWLIILTRTDTVYVGDMSIGGKTTYLHNGNETKLTGRVFRERIMGFDLRSTAFDISYDRNTDRFTFTTYGYGHGAGMSQNGANILANYYNYDYIEILNYYYLGVEVR